MAMDANLISEKRRKILMNKQLGDIDIKELINRRRRQILVHSVIYYKMNQNLITDAQWTEWAVELENLQYMYPEIAEECVYANAFKGFDHSTGFSLPLDDSWAVMRARKLLQIHELYYT